MSQTQMQAASVGLESFCLSHFEAHIVTYCKFALVKGCDARRRRYGLLGIRNRGVLAGVIQNNVIELNKTY